MDQKTIWRKFQAEGAQEMKYVILGLISLLVACASTSSNQNISALQYDRVFQFHVGATTDAEAVKILGAPSTRVEKNGYYTLNYNAPKTGFQRLSLNFNNDNKLSSLLWIPAEGEKEVSLDGAKASFKDANFKAFEEDLSSPHVISRIILYKDETTGVTIRYNPSSHFVEAIAKYDVSARAPAATDQDKKAPYTFGDESTSSK